MGLWIKTGVVLTTLVGAINLPSWIPDRIPYTGSPADFPAAAQESHLALPQERVDTLRQFYTEHPFYYNDPVTIKYDKETNALTVIEHTADGRQVYVDAPFDGIVDTYQYLSSKQGSREAGSCMKYPCHVGGMLLLSYLSQQAVDPIYRASQRQYSVLLAKQSPKKET